MKNLYIKNLKLENYRNFSQHEIEADFKPILLIGKNGSGKTNILEAISLLFPGKGLRGAKYSEICKYGEEGWFSQCIIESKLGTSEILNNFSLTLNKRNTFFNGSKISVVELNKLTNIIWLTPQMDGIFSNSSKTRKKFFDRIVYNFNLKHADNLNKYEYYLQERWKILQLGGNNKEWLRIIEERMAVLSLDIARDRVEILEKLQYTIDNLDGKFPKANLELDGVIENKIIQSTVSKDNLIDEVITKLAENRTKDKISGKTNFGSHKNDLIVTHQEKNILAKYCSTGEQKTLLIAIILAQINICINENKVKPILLLDELFVHLDDIRKNYLIEFFQNVTLQAFISATDLKGIEELVKISSQINL